MSHQQAVVALGQALRLPVTGREQDWDVDLANPHRVEEFLRYFEDNQLDDETAFALMALILSSIEDLVNTGEVSPQIWVRVRRQIEVRPALYADLLRRWQDDDGDQNGFAISPALASM